MSGRAASKAAPGSRMSPTWSSAPAGTFSRLPFDRSSRTCTSSPRAARASATCEPMNPAPPVTIARIGTYRRRAMFVTFEGVDGSGKSTQANLAAAFLAESGREMVATREPGGTSLGERVRELLLDGPEVTAWAEASLFAAARAELAERVIRPALARGAVVVCDRYLDSSLAYQGIARGLGIEQVLELNAAVADLLPDSTFVLLVDAATVAERLGRRPEDRIEREGAGFREAVQEGYRTIAERFLERIVPLDGTRPRDEIAAEIREELAARV